MNISCAYMLVQGLYENKGNISDTDIEAYKYSILVL